MYLCYFKYTWSWVHAHDINLKGASFYSEDSRHVNQMVQMIKPLRVHIASRGSMKSEGYTGISTNVAVFKNKAYQVVGFIQPSFGVRE